jgi:hypothetical protein
MANLKNLSTDTLKNAIWHLNNGRCPGYGIYQSIAEIRQELILRGENGLGFHELDN